MAKKSNQEEVRIVAELRLTADQVANIAKLMGGEGTETEKVVAAAQGTLQDIAGGGLVLTGKDISVIEQSAGVSIGNVDDVLEMAESSTGRKGGKLAGWWEVDPTYEETITQMAEFQGREVHELVQSTIDTCVDNGWLYGEVVPNPERVLMPPDAKKELEELLKGQFSNGSELANLIREALGVNSTFIE